MLILLTPLCAPLSVRPLPAQIVLKQRTENSRTGPWPVDIALFQAAHLAALGATLIFSSDKMAYFISQGWMVQGRFREIGNYLSEQQFAI